MPHNLIPLRLASGVEIVMGRIGKSKDTLFIVGPRDVIGLMTGDIYTRNPIITGSKALQNGDRLTVETETKGE